MPDNAILTEQAKAYVKKHPPDTGYTIKAMREVCGAGYPEGTNLMVQFALQFDGRETSEDLTQWDSAEKRLPYGDGRSLDARSDCSSFVQNLFDLFFGMDIGTWTEAQWKKYRKNEVAFEDLRPCDLIFWNFKKGRNVSHVALYIGGGKIIHTTSPGNPLRVDTAKYSQKNRVCCARVLTDAQYQSLLSSGQAPQEPKPVNTEMPLVRLNSIGRAVIKLQTLLNARGALLKVDGIFGKKTLEAVKTYQKANRLQVDGIAGKQTWASLSG